VTGIPIRCRAVSVVVLRRDPAGAGQILMLRRTAPPVGAWCQVAGGIEENETAWQAALREMHEETGLRPVEFCSADICEQFYSAEADCIDILPVFAAIVAPGATVTLNAEHDACRRVAPDTAARLVPFPGQAEMLVEVARRFLDPAPPALSRIAIAAVDGATS